MSYIVIRKVIVGYADVLAFKTKRQAEEWIARTVKFWKGAIKHKQVHIEYAGKSGLRVGVYMGYEPEIAWKCREETEHEAPKSKESRPVDRREERVAP